MVYPASFWETTADHLIILCRDCHELVHGLLPLGIKKDQLAAANDWSRIIELMQAWFVSKSKLMIDPEHMPGESRTNKTLRKIIGEFGRENKLIHARVRELEYTLSEAIGLRQWSNYSI